MHMCVCGLVWAPQVPADVPCPAAPALLLESMWVTGQPVTSMVAMQPAPTYQSSAAAASGAAGEEHAGHSFVVVGTAGGVLQVRPGLVPHS